MADSPTSAAAPPPTRRARALVVEDEPLVAHAISTILQRGGYDVVGVVDTRDATVEAFHQHAPDLVVMDIHIRGDINGIDTAAELLRLGDVPIVFLTGTADPETVERAAALSAYGYVLKPFDDRSLLATITIALERHAADARLRLLESAIRATGVGIVLLHYDGDDCRVTSVNTAFLEGSGLERHAILGKAPHLFGLEAGDEPGLKLQEAIARREPARHVVDRLMLSGRRRWSLITLSPVADRSGTITDMVILSLDITREKEAQVALAEAQRLEIVGQLTAGIAHDFNNILGAIMALGGIAHDSVKDEEVRTDLEQVIVAAQRGAQLTRKLLAFTRRSDQPTLTPSELGYAANQARKMVEKIVGPGIHVDCRTSPEAMVVGLDAISIEQILLNLAAYARQSMPGGGQLRIEVTCPAEHGRRLGPGMYARIELHDTGDGIDDEVAERLFGPAPGAERGLGLATCQMLIESVGGIIWAQGTPGVGTRFTIELPRLAGIEREAPSSLDALTPQAVPPGTLCLLVEDEAPLRRASARALRAVGFNVIEAGTGETAVRALDGHGPQLRLVISDLMLPGISGVDVLQHAKAVAPRAALLAMTGHPELQLAQSGGGIGFLLKPFTSAALTRRAIDAVDAPADVVEEKTDPVSLKRRERGASLSKPPFGNQILLVEDDTLTRESLATILRSRGFSVLEAGTGAEAVAATTGDPLDLAIIDVNLPDADGLDLLVQFRGQDPLLPVIMITGMPTLDIAQRALKGRATAFLTKPIRANELVQMTEAAIGEGQIARMQRKLLLSKAPSTSILNDFAGAEARFAESLAKLFVVFQPIVRAQNREVFAYEALVRSRGPYGNPAELLAAAEMLGRLEVLGRRIRELISETLYDNPQRLEPIFVNLHPLELQAEILTSPDEPLMPWASRIVFEVTERAQLSSTEDLADVLKALRSVGYRIALDDLGEGYAGLSWLLKLTPDIAKLDMSLVRDIDSSKLKREIVASLGTICRRAKAHIVAEGVETLQEAEVLRDLGCDLLQGYYFARPGPAFPSLS